MEGSATPKSVQRAALVVATMASFLTPFLGSSINVALPTIGEALGMDAVALSWVATAFILTSAVFLVPMGRVADMVGRRKVFIAGMLLFTLSTLGGGLARSAGMLVAFRALQGVSAAMIFGTGLAILTAVFPAGERGRVLGLNAATVYTGLSAGPFFGGLLTHHWGWRSIFLISVPAGLATAIVAWRGLQGEWTGESKGRFDVTGCLIYAAGLTALTFGFSASSGPVGVGLVGGGLVTLGAFYLWEKRTANPMLDVALLGRNVVFARSSLASLINYSATFAVTFMMSLYLQYLRGLDPRGAGIILLTQSVVMAAVSPLAGRLSDRTEPRIVASVGMGLGVVGLVWLCFLREDTPMASIIATLVVLGTGFGLFSSPNTNAIMSSVERRDYGVASATVGTVRMVGQMLSMGLAAAVLSIFVGHTAVTPALHGRFLAGLHVAFLISSALCVVGVFASLSRGNVRTPTKS